MADPWVVTPGERAKHDEQFNTLRPTNGFITGDQAKGFFLQSRLPPPVLGIIWALSDIDGDGKMNLHEFSIACKLINLKLRGFNLPQALPPSLKQTACGSSTGAPPLPAVGTSMEYGMPSTVGVGAGTGLGLTGLDIGLKVTPARAPGPVVSPVVMSTSVPTPASIPFAHGTALAPMAPPLVAPPSSISTSMPGIPPGIIPGSCVASTAGVMPGSMPGMISGIMPGSMVARMPALMTGPRAGAQQSMVVTTLPTAL
ncbi:hypothetical protein OTU49_013413, partial [Cherax quadricarinatus]